MSKERLNRIVFMFLSELSSYRAGTRGSSFHFVDFSAHAFTRKNMKALHSNYLWFYPTNVYGMPDHPECARLVEAGVKRYETKKEGE